MIEVKQGIFNNKTITTMSDIAEMPQMDAKASIEIPSLRYKKAIQHMILLRTMGEITNDEVKSLVSLLKSSDSENWNIAELAIEKKLS